jgi:glutamyl-tRNA(Gln) amidotransferase subunit D
MYSEQIQQLLDEKNIETGDRIKADNHEGILMPKPSSGNPDVLVLKLESGYNIGVQPEELELVEKNEVEDPETETDVDMKHEEGKKDILVLHTGGTIASRVSYETGGVKASFEQEDMVQMYPEVIEEANIHSDVYVGKIMSEDMEPGHWEGIAEKIDEVKDDYDGIIIGHGTDTLSSTAAALNLMLKGIDTGVLVVGSQRSSDRPSTDARMNLFCATKFLSETEFTGIGVCMHGSSSDDRCVILDGAKSRKMHTSRRNAFEPINTEELATVDYESGQIDYEGDRSEKEYQKRVDLNSNVGFLKVRPGLEPEEIQFYIDQDYDGVIIEGTGLGHMPISAFDEETEHHKQIQEKLEELTEDTLVAMTSNCIHGRVDMDVYDNQIKVKDRGVIESEDMHPELAYVKMMWSLGQSDGLEEAESIYQSNINGEISSRTLYKE